jgi:hypothetical protein
LEAEASPQPPNHLTSFRLFILQLLCIEVGRFGYGSEAPNHIQTVNELLGWEKDGRRMGEGWEDGKKNVDIALG